MKLIFIILMVAVVLAIAWSISGTQKQMKKKRKKVYLSGPISDRPIADVITEFSLAQNTALSKCYDVYNPLMLAEKIGYHQQWIEYMKHSIKELSKCDYIWFISDLPDSKGVAIERAIAENFGIKEIKS